MRTENENFVDNGSLNTLLLPTTKMILTSMFQNTFTNKKFTRVLLILHNVMLVSNIMSGRSIIAKLHLDNVNSERVERLVMMIMIMIFLNETFCDTCYMKSWRLFIWISDKTVFKLGQNFPFSSTSSHQALDQ